MESMSDLPEAVRRHLAALADETSIQPREDALARLAHNWRAKQRLYEEQCDALALIPVERLADDDPRGFLALTRSGSLVSVGPLVDGARSLEYASISIRADVPPLVQSDAAAVDGEVATGHPIRLNNCPIEATSDLFTIRTFGEGVAPEEQTKRLREAMIFLTNGFVRENTSLVVDNPGNVQHFTLKSIVASIASRTGATQADVRTIVDDYLTTVETGMLLGERVSLGRLGTLRLTRHAARKARMGRNPATGEEMLIPAKGETAAPKLSFSGRLKDRAALVPLERIDGGDDDES